MYISKKAMLLLQLLLEKTEPITINELAENVGMSSRSTRSYMREVAEVIEKCGGTLVNKPGVGSCIQADSDVRDKIQHELGYNSIGTFDRKQRRNYMLYILLHNDTSYTIQQFSDELLVSRNIIAQELILVEEWLSRFELSLQKKPGIGLSILGEEMNLRQAMAFFFRFYTIPNIPYSEPEYPLPPNQIEEDVCIRLNTYFPKVSLRHLYDGMSQIEKHLKFQWTTEARGVLLSQLCVLYSRIRANEVLKDENLWRLIPERVMWLAGELRNCLNEGQSLRIPVDEIGYLAVCIMAADQQLTRDYSEETEPYSKWEDLAKEILNIIAEITECPLGHDRQLVHDMACALNSIIIRLRYHIWYTNPLLDDIKKRYMSLFGACWSINTLMESRLGLQLNENEVANICLLISSSITRAQKQQIVRTAVVCASGIGVSQYLANIIEEQIPSIRVDNIWTYAKAKQELDKQDIDLVISSGIKVDFEPTVHIHVPIRDEDFEIVKRTVTQILRKRVRSEMPLLSNFAELVLLDSSGKTKREVIAEGSKVLQQHGNVTEGFEAAVLRREAVHATDIGNRIAIPHPLGGEQEIQKPAIAVIRLQKPIPWGEESDEMVDLIFMLAFRYIDSMEIRGVFKHFYFVLRNEKVLEEIRSADSVEKLYEIFRRNHLG